MAQRGSGRAPVPIDTSQIHNLVGLVEGLSLLRVRAARGSGRQRVGLDGLAARAQVPRSTLHAYLSGARIPPEDVLDRIVLALGATPPEQRGWADALFRVVANRDREARTADDHYLRARSGARPRQLPAAPRGFRGREEIRAALIELLTAPRSSAGVVAVTGPGGIGKTALVAHCAHAVADHFPDGQLWVDLRGFGATSMLTAGDALERMLHALGVSVRQLPSEVDMRAAMFRTAAAGRRMLVVLDDARNAAQVVPLLAGAPEIVTVVTSRESLRSLGTQFGASRVRVPRLSDGDAYKILTSSLSIEATKTLTRTSIVAHCDGLPLAARIVAELISGDSAEVVAAVAEALGRDSRSRLDTLDLGDESVEVSVRSVLSRSYLALSDDATTVLRRAPLLLSPHVDGGSAHALLGADRARAVRALHTLADAHLVEKTSTDRFRLHDLVLTAAREWSGDDAPIELEAARTRLAAYLLAGVQQRVAEIDPNRPLRLAWSGPPLPDVAPMADSESARDWMLTHVDQLRAVIVECAASRDRSLYSWHLAQGTWRAIWPWLDVSTLAESILAARDAAAAQQSTGAEILMSRLLGALRGRRGLLAEAESDFRRAVDTARRDPVGAESVNPLIDLSNLGRAWVFQGRNDDAERLLRETLSWPQPDGPDPFCIKTLVELEMQRDDLTAARSWLTLATPHEADADADVDADVTVKLELLLLDAELALMEQDEGRAAALLDAVDATVHGRENLEIRAALLLLRARLCDDVDEAVDIASTSVRMVETLGDRFEEVAALSWLGEVALRADRWKDAAASADRAVGLATSSDWHYGRARALLIRGLARGGGGDLRGDEDLRTALRIATGCGFSGIAQRAKTVLTARGR